MGDSLVENREPIANRTFSCLSNKRQSFRLDLYLNNTTGFFLDDPDAAVTAARKKALVDFVRSGKGLAGIHAASDSYHHSTLGPQFGGMLSSGVLSAASGLFRVCAISGALAHIIRIAVPVAARPWGKE